MDSPNIIAEVRFYSGRETPIVSGYRCVLQYQDTTRDVKITFDDSVNVVSEQFRSVFVSFLIPFPSLQRGTSPFYCIDGDNKVVGVGFVKEILGW